MQTSSIQSQLKITICSKWMPHKQTKALNHLLACWKRKMRTQNERNIVRERRYVQNARVEHTNQTTSFIQHQISWFYLHSLKYISSCKLSTVYRFFSRIHNIDFKIFIDFVHAFFFIYHELQDNIFCTMSNLSNTNQALLLIL